MNPYESGAVIDMNVGHNSATPAPIGADALREALWVCVEHNALHFGERHNTVVQGRAALAGAAQAAQWDACDAKHIAALTEIVRMPNAEYVADAHNAAVKYLRARAAKEGGEA